MKLADLSSGRQTSIEMAVALQYGSYLHASLADVLQIGITAKRIRRQIVARADECDPAMT
jgi:hypothetical protein